MSAGLDRFPGVDLDVGTLAIGAGVTIAPGTVIRADEAVFEDGAAVGPDCDLRAGRLAVGPRAAVAAKCRALVADELSLGAGTRIDRDADLVARSIRIGRSTYLGARLTVGYGASMEERSRVRIGDQCQIGPDVILNPTEPITIGSMVGIGSHASVWTHGYHSGHSALDGFGAAFAEVSVRDGAWIGYHATLLPGTVVGHRSIVGSMAVVNADVPDDVLAAGVPAVVKRHLAPRGMSVAETGRWVSTVVEDWLRRLSYKGIEVTADSDRLWSLTGAATWQVSLAGPAGSVVEVRRLGTGSEASADFDFASRTLRGRLDEVSHDFRDYCRRRTVLFPHPENSIGIVPERFARLM